MQNAFSETTWGIYLVNANHWPAICHLVELNGAKTEQDKHRAVLFLVELHSLFDRLQEKYGNLPQKEREKCGQNGVAADISFKVDMVKKEILLDRIYKYCSIENHLFKELADILKHHFPEFTLVVPALKGYQLAEEIHRYLGDANIKWIYLKSSEDERLLMGEHLDRMGITFEGIIEDTKSHYAEIGGMEKVQMKTRCGSEISMYLRDDEGEEEVLWMLVNVPLS
jgi:hypothetical protein